MARQARSHRCKPRNRSGGRLARLAWLKPKKGGKRKGGSWRDEIARLRSKRPGLPSHSREPNWRPDIWEPIPGPHDDRRAYDAWIKFNARQAEAMFFLCQREELSRRALRRLRKAEARFSNFAEAALKMKLGLESARRDATGT